MAQPIAFERLQMRTHFDNICSQYPPWFQQPLEKRETLARRMERNCFEVVINESQRDGIDRLFTEKKFVDRYSSICSRVLANLNISGSVGNSSEYLLDGLISGSVDAYKVAEMDSYDLCPDASRIEREEIALRRKQKATEKVSRAHTCKKCGGNETIFLEYQARAADEGSSHSIKCVNCEFVWRM